MPNKSNTLLRAREVLLSLSAEEAKQARELLRQLQQRVEAFQSDLATSQAATDPGLFARFQETWRQLTQTDPGVGTRLQETWRQLETESVQQDLEAVYDPNLFARLQERISQSIQIFEPAPQLQEFRQPKAHKRQKRPKRAQPQRERVRIVLQRIHPGGRIPSRKELPDSALVAGVEKEFKNEFKNDPTLRKLPIPDRKTILREARRLKR